MSVVVEHIGHVTQLTLDRPETANAIDVEMALSIAEAIDTFSADENARVLVVTGAGERSSENAQFGALASTDRPLDSPHVVERLTKYTDRR